MSKDEAIKELTDLLPEEFLSEYSEALDMAIKALDQEPCDDAVSRQAVLEIIEREEFKGDALYEIEKLPSVSPQSKVGKWKRISRDMYVQHAMAYYECSECGKKMIGTHNYCPNCGAKMSEIPTGAEGSEKND